MKKIFLRPRNRQKTSYYKRASQEFYLCSFNRVLTGRCHSGDENGKTWFEDAELEAVDESGNPVSGVIRVSSEEWSEWTKESSGQGFDALNNRVLVGREHKGDENGLTRYATAIVRFNDNNCMTADRVSSDSIKESKGIWCCSDSERVMTGRHHTGDENGSTYYNYSKLYSLEPSTEPAPKGTIIVPDKRTQSESMKESKSSFLCPSNMVLTGRLHSGDENGNTIYEYASLKAISASGEVITDADITVQNVTWVEYKKESTGEGYDAPYGKVIVGRKHSGDENGSTAYAIGDVFYNGHPTFISGYHVSAPKKESDGIWFKTNDYYVITARHHYGDENGTTYYGLGMIVCDEPTKPDERIVLHVKMHSEDPYFPMNPVDYIHLSRLRRHVKGGTDYGYNKITNTFVKGDSHSSEYYDIPLGVIMNQHTPYGKYELMNLRPHDPNSFGKGEVFLQPDDHLTGDSDPNYRVPCIVHYANEKTISYWFFFGYDYAKDVTGIVSGSHQGDWECVTVSLDGNGKITGASLSCHSGANSHPANELEIVHGKKDELTVYCAKGSHAFYNKPGTYSTVNVLGVTLSHDGDENGTTTYYFASLKAVDINGNEDCNNITVEDLEWTEWHKQSESQDFFMTTEMQGKNSYSRIITGREHKGDENGMTRYQTGLLKYKGKLVKVIPYPNADMCVYSSHKIMVYPKQNLVIIGIKHSGDENGITTYCQGYIVADK